MVVATHEIVVEIGTMPILVRTGSAEFAVIIQERYTGYVNPRAKPVFEFDVEIVPPQLASDDGDDVSVQWESGRWKMKREDFKAEWNPATGKGWIRQAAYPYAMDAVMRITHSLLLARQGGLLVHAASAIRNGKAFLFSGPSEAGKTTMSRLAPPDATLLTDEISYLRPDGEDYIAFGTPFAGELGQPGVNVQAPLHAVYLLEKGRENKIEDIGAADAVRALLGNILFFTYDRELVDLVFETACKLVERVPVKRLTFFPDERVWELIQ